MRHVGILPRSCLSGDRDPDGSIFAQHQASHESRPDRAVPLIKAVREATERFQDVIGGGGGRLQADLRLRDRAGLRERWGLP